MLINEYKRLKTVTNYSYRNGIFATDDEEDEIVELIFADGTEYFTYTFSYNTDREKDEICRGGVHGFMPIPIFRKITEFIDAIFAEREDAETMREFVDYLEKEKGDENDA